MNVINENDIIDCSNDERCCGDYNIYVITTLVSSLVANDLKHIHLHANGEQFDRIHDIAQEYYDEVSEELDYLCELSLEHIEYIPNLTKAGIIISEYAIQECRSYNYNFAISQMYDIIMTYISYLYSLRNQINNSSEQSYLDDKIRYWEKELKYKLNRRNNYQNSNCDNDMSGDIEIVSVPIDDEVYEATQSSSIGQHKNTGTKSYKPSNNINSKLDLIDNF